MGGNQPELISEHLHNYWQSRFQKIGRDYILQIDGISVGLLEALFEFSDGFTFILIGFIRVFFGEFIRFRDPGSFVCSICSIMALLKSD